MPAEVIDARLTPLTPGSAGKRGIFAARVVHNQLICTDHYRLRLHLAAFPACRPGQFLQLTCRSPESQEYEIHELVWEPGQKPPTVLNHELAERNAFLRRPFSIAGRSEDAAGVQIDVIQRVVGRGTGYLSHLREGDSVDLLGPLGNGFDIPQDLKVALLVGGGVGIPPMFYMAQALAARGIKAVGFVGAQRKDLVPLNIPSCSPAPSVDGDPVLNATEFSQHGYPTVISTDDGSLGMKGFVTAALQRFIDKNPSLPRDKTVVFVCGPTPMMRATAAVAEKAGIVCQVSLEQPMACGMGTCQSCVIRVKQDTSPDGWVYKLTCTDGPVFDSRTLKW